MNLTSHLRFAVIGCGLISDTHASALAEIKDASLVGAWDLNEERADDFCRRYGIARYPSYQALLEDPATDVVCICTPSFCHKEQAIDALRHGKHVVLEKPMALSAADAQEVCDTVEETGKKLTSICQLRFAEDILRLKKLLDDNAFGKLCFCDLYMKSYRDAAYYEGSSWRGTKRGDGGGALMNQGIHGVDLMLFLVGPATLLDGRIQTRVHNIEVEDSAVAMLAYDCGALGVIEASTCAFPGFRRKIEINGERGYAVLCDNTLTTLYLDGTMHIDCSIDPHPSTASTPQISSCALHKAQIENLIDAIRTGAPLVSDHKAGYDAVHLIESIYRASEFHDRT